MANGKKERKEGEKSYEVHKDRMESHSPSPDFFFAFVSTLVKSLFLHLFLKSSCVMTVTPAYV